MTYRIVRFLEQLQDALECIQSIRVKGKIPVDEFMHPELERFHWSLELLKLGEDDAEVDAQRKYVPGLHAVELRGNTFGLVHRLALEVDLTVGENQPFAGQQSFLYTSWPLPHETEAAGGGESSLHREAHDLAPLRQRQQS